VWAVAAATDAALFFDEADAIFGKRAAVKDASDRFANIEVGFLLQRIESFPGLVILATNLRKNIDAAFLRRLQVVVEFPTPDLASRARIWAGVWPAGAPVDPSVDPQLLAERFDLSGGHIRNIALTAAYAAAEEGTAITLRHVLAAARGEYRKLDKLTREHSFLEPT
jgi:SpoVK/Ycf46/Vps4 family AAA+-type ATPase